MTIFLPISKFYCLPTKNTNYFTDRYLSELERGKESASLGKAITVIKRLGLKMVLTGQLTETEDSDENA